MQLPETDRYAYDKQYLLTRIAILFGGRIAEEVFMHQMTTGASNDFERATQLARDMVMRFGMSDKMGVMVYAENEGEVFLGRAVTKTTHISEKTMQAVDTEIRRILEEQYGVARKLIEEHRDKIEKMASALLKWETLDAEQLDDIMAGKDPREPKPPESKDARKLAESQDKAPTQAKEGDSVKVSSEEKEPGDKAPKETASESAPSAAASDASKESTPEDSVKKSRKRTVKKDASAE